MGAAAGPVAGIASIASVGLSALGTMRAAQGTAAADNYQAQLLEQQAAYGRLKATQTAGQMTEKLNQTLGNIDAIRAAAHTDPTSPTGAAVRQREEDIGTSQKTIQVNSILAQSRMDESQAAYLRTAGNNALLAGQMGATGQLIGGLSGALANKNFGFGSLAV